MASSSSHEASGNPTNSQFFKVMMPGFRKRLDIPPSFCKHLSQERSNKALLTSAKGSWGVKVHRNDDNTQICFEEGWDRFVKKHDLHIADFLVFQHLGNLSFQVVIFGFSTNCEKQFVEESHKLSNFHDGQKMATLDSFSVTMRASHGLSGSSYLTVPVAFWRSNNISEHSSVLLRGPSRGETQKVRLRWDRFPDRRLAMVQGWHEFFKSHNLKLGDVCRFKIDGTMDNSTLVMNVEINPC